MSPEGVPFCGEEGEGRTVKPGSKTEKAAREPIGSGKSGTRNLELS